MSNEHEVRAGRAARECVEKVRGFLMGLGAIDGLSVRAARLMEQQIFAAFQDEHAWISARLRELAAKHPICASDLSRFASDLVNQ